VEKRPERLHVPLLVVLFGEACGERPLSLFFPKMTRHVPSWFHLDGHFEFENFLKAHFSSHIFFLALPKAVSCFFKPLPPHGIVTQNGLSLKAERLPLFFH